MRQSITLVVYKDHKNADVRYFGPFVDIHIASDFAKAIPEPLKGGFKGYRTTQPFTATEASLVSDLILNARKAVNKKQSLVHEAI